MASRAASALAAMRPRRRAGQGGAAAVEFALVVPALLLLVFGAVQYGFYFWSMQGGSSAARDAARSAAVGDPTSCADFTALLEDDVSAMSKGNVSVRREYESAATPVQVGDRVTIAIGFDSFDMGLPLVPVPGGGRVEQTATARVEYVPDDSIGDCS